MTSAVAAPVPKRKVIDAFTPLVCLAARTQRIALGTAIPQPGCGLRDASRCTPMLWPANMMDSAW